MTPSYSQRPFKGAVKHSGFSLVEMMIAIVLSLFLMAGMLSIFVSSRVATSKTIDSGERQENATFALQLLTKDLKQAYFFAQSTGENKASWNLNNITLEQSDDCLDNTSTGSFPANNFRPLWASSITDISALAMDCIADEDAATALVSNSDYLSIKRVRGSEISEKNNLNADRFYLDITNSSLNLYRGDASEVTSGDISPVWEYMHHVYYLDTLDEISRLRRLTLKTSGMVREEVLVEGVESMQFMFALDAMISSERDGSVDSFVGTSDVKSSDWDTGRVIGMKVFLLIRSLEPTAGYINDNSYQMGDYLFPAKNDSYKRELVSTVIIFPNSVVAVND